MDFALSEEQQMIFDMAYDFGQDKIAPFAVQWEEEENIPKSLWPEIAALGFGGLYVRRRRCGFLSVPAASSAGGKRSLSVRPRKEAFPSGCVVCKLSIAVAFRARFGFDRSARALPRSASVVKGHVK